MARGGSRPGAGRPRGSRGRKTVERLEAIDTSGLSPLDYMLKILRDDAQPQAIRLDAAKAAAQYVHPRLAAVDTTLKGDPNAPVTLVLKGHEIDG